MFYQPTTNSRRCHTHAIALALTLFSAAFINPSTAHAATYKSLHDFWANPSGANPYGGLVRVADGTLYGTTMTGGGYGFGTIFSISVNGGFRTLYSFKGGVEPAMPAVAMSAGPDGCLYGATNLGGANTNGTLFKFDPATTALTVLYSFSGLSYSGLSAPVVAKDGSVFGSYSSSTFGGTSFTYRWSASGGLKTILGYSTILCSGGDGYIYGCGHNVLFKMNSVGTMIKLRDLFVADGLLEPATLTLGPGATLWGACSLGGPSTYGAVYKLSTNGQGFVIIHNNTADDPVTFGSSAVGPDSRFYAFSPASKYGSGYGRYFSVGADGSLKIVLNKTDGNNYSGPVFGPDGQFYAEMANSQATPSGSLFKVTAGGAVTPIRTLETKDLTYASYTPVTFANGDLIGVGIRGGVFGKGGIYRFTSTGKWTIQYNFIGALSQYASSVTLGADGNGYSLAGGQFCKVAADGSVTTADITPAAPATAVNGNPMTLGSDGRLVVVGGQDAYMVSYGGVVQKIRAVPQSSGKFALAADGYLYTLQGFDANGYLLGYKLTPAGTVVAFKYTGFGAVNSYTTPAVAGPGNSLYSACLAQQSVIYKLNVKSGKVTKLYTFSPDLSAWRLNNSRIAVRTDGTVFGIAAQWIGNTSVEKRALYSISPSGQFSILMEFPISNNANGFGADIAMEGDHSLIGVMNGGLHGDGVLFRVSGL